MALNEIDKANFQTLLDAARNGDLALRECTRDGEYRAVICAVNTDGETYDFIPLGEMVNGDPYEIYQPTGEEETEH